MSRVVQSIAWTTTILRERYIAIQDDTPIGWSIGGTLSYVGLGALAGVKPAAPALTEDQQKELFLQQYVNRHMYRTEGKLITVDLAVRLHRFLPSTTLRWRTSCSAIIWSAFPPQKKTNQHLSAASCPSHRTCSSTPTEILGQLHTPTSPC